MRFNTTISEYWLWLVIIAGVLAAVPSVPYSGKPGGTSSLNVAFLYRDALRGDTRSWSAVGDDVMIVLHAVLSVVLAVIATVIHHAWAKRRKPDYTPDAKTFTLGGLLLTTAAVACAFSFLASVGAIYAIYLVVLIFVAGRFATLFLAAVGL
jgi:hypothetical protein